MSLLVGAALDRGCLRSTDQTIGELLGPLGPSDPRKASITVRQLLTMSSGLGEDELGDVQQYNRFILADDHLAYVWNQLTTNPPGHFVYSSAAYWVLSPIVTRACGQTTADFARDVLFGPLGIGPREWEAGPPENVANGAAGLMLTPRDMVAIGNLVLQQGGAAGGRVVSAAWVRDATRMQVSTPAQPPATGYGLGWWTGQLGAWEYAFASGYGGQFIVVVPEPRLVVVATNRWQSVGAAVNRNQWMATINLIMQDVLPAFAG
jgi:CubicO group peptidase (beta-lactamase class C family)